jgi:hypothetical protein
MVRLILARCNRKLHSVSLLHACCEEHVGIVLRFVALARAVWKSVTTTLVEFPEGSARHSNILLPLQAASIRRRGARPEVCNRESTVQCVAPASGNSITSDFASGREIRRASSPIIAHPHALSDCFYDISKALLWQIARIPNFYAIHCRFPNDRSSDTSHHVEHSRSFQESGAAPHGACQTHVRRSARLTCCARRAA